MRLSVHVLRTLFALLFVFVCFSAFALPVHADATGQPDQAAPPSTRQRMDHDIDRPHRKDHDIDRPQRQANASTPPQNVSYGGGPVMAGTASVYAIFWEPTGNVSAHYQSIIERFFNDVGGSPLYRLAHQYKQANGGFPSDVALAGVWTDTRAYPHSVVLDADIQHEVTHAQQVNGWHSSLNNLFFVFTERKANVCMDNTRTECTSGGYCAYHSWTDTNMLYATIPYQSSFSCDYSSGPNHDDADQAIDNISHELMEAVTDPTGYGWYTPDGSEIGDVCVDNFGRLNVLGANVMWNHHPYLLQKEWDNATRSCRLAPRAQV